MSDSNIAKIREYTLYLQVHSYFDTETFFLLYSRAMDPAQHNDRQAEASGGIANG